MFHYIVKKTHFFVMRTALKIMRLIFWYDGKYMYSTF